MHSDFSLNRNRSSNTIGLDPTRDQLSLHFPVLDKGLFALNISCSFMTQNSCRGYSGMDRLGSKTRSDIC